MEKRGGTASTHIFSPSISLSKLWVGQISISNQKLPRRAPSEPWYNSADQPLTNRQLFPCFMLLTDKPLQTPNGFMGITALVHRIQRSPARGEKCTLEIQMCVLPKCLSHFGAVASCSHEIFLCGLVCAGQHKGGECSAERQTALSLGLV